MLNHLKLYSLTILMTGVAFGQQWEITLNSGWSYNDATLEKLSTDTLHIRIGTLRSQIHVADIKQIALANRKKQLNHLLFKVTPLSAASIIPGAWLGAFVLFNASWDFSMPIGASLTALAVFFLGMNEVDQLGRTTYYLLDLSVDQKVEAIQEAVEYGQITSLQGHESIKVTVKYMKNSFDNAIARGIFVYHDDSVLQIQRWNRKILKIEKDQVLKIRTGIHDVTDDFLSESQMEQVKRNRKRMLAY